MKVWRAISAAAVTAAMVGGGALAAAAFSPPANCGTEGRLCIYRDANYANSLGYRQMPFGLTDISPGNRNELSGYSNNSDRNGAWYDGLNGSGVCFNMIGRTKLAEYGLFERDRAESWKGTSAC